MDRRMDDQRRKVLQQNIMTFKDEMTSVEDVMDCLVQVDVLNESLKAELMARKTDRERTGALQAVIPKRGLGAFDHYYLALKDTRNYVLAKILEDHLVDESLKSRSNLPATPHVQVTGQAVQETFPKTAITSPTDDDIPEVPEVWPDVNVSPLDVNVVKCGPDDVEMKKKLFDGDNVYGMKNKNSRILIINNEVFEKSKDTNKELGVREGTNIDASCLDMVFKQMGFKNRCTKRDLTGQGILGVLKEEAHNRKPSDEGFICFILSHGNTGSVYGTDGQPVLLEVIYSQFDGIKCPALAGKPKLFFIQACQGTMKDNVSAGATGDTKSLADQLSHLTIATEATDSHVDVPVKADMLLATATTPGYVSWRNKEHGTWFIQALVHMLKNHAHKYEINKILQLVNRMVAKQTTQVGAFKQVSEKKDTLTKDLYFFPGLGPEEPFFSLQ